MDLEQHKKRKEIIKTSTKDSTIYIKILKENDVELTIWQGYHRAVSHLDTTQLHELINSLNKIEEKNTQLKEK